jgi:hypothetical protein
MATNTTFPECRCCARRILLSAGLWCRDCRRHIIDIDGDRHENRTYFAQHGVHCPFSESELTI